MNGLNEIERIEFYKRHIPLLPPKSSQRFFVFRLENGSWLTLKDRIYNGKQLQKHLIKLAPVDVYFSTSRFLNPTNLMPKKKKAGYVWADSLFLGADLYFDLDNKDLDNLLGLVDYLLEFGFEDLKVIETYRGFHIWVLDFEDKLWQVFRMSKSGNTFITDPHVLEERYFRFRKSFAFELSEKFNFDLQVTYDTRRIVRVPNTLQYGKFVVYEVWNTNCPFNLKEALGVESEKI